MWHKCHVYRDGIFQTVESQDVLPTDKFVLSKQPWNVHNNVGTYNSGKILGYYLAEGWKNSHSNNEVEFAININRQDIVDEITTFFNSIGCVVVADRQDDNHIFRMHVYGKQAVAFVSEYILGNKATEKHFSYTLWNTSDDFRRGVFEGYYITDGCPSDNAVAHTTNKELVLDLIVLGASIGEVFRYGVNNNNTRSFKEDKSDKIHFTSYRLRKYKCEEVDGFYLVPVSDVKQIPAKTEYVYNFTVNTPEHLFELPNGIISHQCCRLSLSLETIRKHTGGLFGAGDQTGSVGVCSINIPRIAYLAAKTDDPKDTFYRLLDNRLNLCKKALEAKRREVNKNFDNGLMPYSQEYLPKKFTRHFSTIGVIGFNEACRMLFNTTIADKECITFTLEVLHYILDKCTKFTEETGNMYNAEAVPGEGLSYRFAKIDKKKYPDIITAGTDDAPYYTNSSQLPVDYTSDPFEALELQEELQSTYSSGTVLHFFIGECIDDEEVVAKFVKSVCERSKIPYFSLTPEFSICPKCGYIRGIHETCPNHC